jgi:hypothetical protein
MSKTPYSKQVEILADFYVMYEDDDTIDEGWKNFIKVHDIGFPLCFFIRAEVAEPTIKGESYIDNTWKDFCDAFQLDFDAEWNSLSDMIRARNAQQ